MLKIFTSLSFLAAIPANAGGVTVETCDWNPESKGPIRIVCGVTNNGNAAISGIYYSLLYVEDGRTVPWVKVGFEDQLIQGTTIPGGIEPGETVPVAIIGPDIPARALPQNISIIFAVTRVLN